MQKIVLLFFVILVSGGFISCNHTKNKKQRQSSLSSLNSESKRDFKPNIRYAKGFRITPFDGGEIIELYNPWKNNEILRTYVLVPRSNYLPKDLPENAIIVRTPVRSIALFSNTQIGPLVSLGLADKIVGMTRANKVYNPDLYAKVLKGEIVSLGGAHNKNIDIERILELEPDLIILSAFNEVKSGETRLEDMGLKLAYALNWMETTPLGRAEWIKFVAAFFEKGFKANAIFDEVETNYLNLKELAVHAKRKTNVLLGWSYKGTWFVPGGQNYLVSYLRDAGANYFLFDDDTRGNIPMSVESVLDECQNADMWIYPGMCKSMNEVENGGEIFTQFKAYQKGEVYNIYKRKSQYGGSDWWEKGCVRPDIVLKDFIKVLHPELLSKQDSTYFISKLKWEK